MIKVKDLKIGDRIKFNKTVAYVVEIKLDKVMLNKKKGGAGQFSENMYSARFDDLDNRVELV